MSSTFDTFTARQMTLDYFVGRKRERERVLQLARFLAGLQLGEQPTLLQFYGVGGIGKTAFLRQAVDDLQIMRNEGGAKSPLQRLALPHLQLDHHKWTPQSSPEDFFWWLRCAFSSAHVPLPLFDSLYFMLWRLDNPGKTFSLESQAHGFLQHVLHSGAELVEANTSWAKSAGGVISHAAEQVHDLFEASQEAILKGTLAYTKTAGPVLAIFNSLRGQRDRKDVINLLGFDPRHYERREQLIHDLAEVLFCDVANWLAGDIDRAVLILLDGWERVQGKNSGYSIEQAVEDFCQRWQNPDDYRESPSTPTVKGRCAVLLLGRHVWPGPPTAWSESHLIGGLMEDEARDVIAKRRELYRLEMNTEGVLPRQEELATRALVQLNESKVVERLLQVSVETHVANTNRHHPFRLSLGIEHVHSQGEQFLVEQLDVAPEKLNEVFLGGLEKNHPDLYEDLLTLSLALECDEALYAFLHNEGYLRHRAQDFHRVITPLYSFIQPGVQAGQFRFHNLMQEALLAEAKRNHREGARKTVLCLLDHYRNAATVERVADFGEAQMLAWERGLQLALFHLQAQPEPLLSLSEDPEWKAFQNILQILSSDFSFFTIRRETILREVLKLHEQHPSFGPEHTNTLNALGILANLVFAKGDLAESEALHRRALTIHDRILGRENSNTLANVNSLATVLAAKGDFSGAESLYRRNMGTQERLQGTNHQQTLAYVSNLAGLLYRKGDLAGAEPLYRRALETYEQTLGLENPHTLQALNNLGALLKAKGDLVGAAPLYRRAVEAQERLLGHEHPDTLITINNLAGLLREQGDLAKSEALYRRVLQASERLLGIEHQTTVNAVSNLGALLHFAGNLTGAEPLLRRSLRGWERLMGRDHPSTLLSVCNLAGLLRDKGDYVWAELLADEAAQGLLAKLGPDNQQTKVAQKNLAVIRRERAAKLHSL